MERLSSLSEPRRGQQMDRSCFRPGRTHRTSRQNPKRPISHTGTADKLIEHAYRHNKSLSVFGKTVEICEWMPSTATDLKWRGNQLGYSLLKEPDINITVSVAV